MKITRLAVPLLLLAGAATMYSDTTASAIGLSLLFQNSQMPKLTLAGDAKRFLQEIDIVNLRNVVQTPGEHRVHCGVFHDFGQ